MAGLELEGYRSAELIAKLDMRCRRFPGSTLSSDMPAERPGDGFVRGVCGKIRSGERGV